MSGASRVAHACQVNPMGKMGMVESGAEAEDWEYKASLGYMVRLSWMGTERIEPTWGETKPAYGYSKIVVGIRQPPL